ncbi:MAG: porphobilinogen synthase [Planctomycetota bacterium]
MTPPPLRKLRRLRGSESIRALRRETTLSSDDFILPLFVVEDSAQAGEVSSMPGVFRHTLDGLSSEMEQIASRELRAVILFGLPKTKDPSGSTAFAENGIVPQAIRRIREIVPDIVIFTDVCLCQYTDHGHCGIVKDGAVLNDKTCEILAKIAVAHALAGADFVAPSAMMDAMVEKLRSALDDAKCQQVGILSYSAKYASAFYGPFREAADSKPQFGDRRGYQMDPANAREALAEVEQDIAEGADMVMVKPALPYLDVIRRVRDSFPAIFLAAYQVSGEYAMIKAAAQNGWLDEHRTVLESLTAIKRAGADIILTYFAKEVARWLKS